MPARETAPFSKIRKGSRFSYGGQSFTKVNKTQGADWDDNKRTFKPDTEVEKPPKRMSKTEQWNDACSRARQALEVALDHQNELNDFKEDEKGNDEYAAIESKLISAKSDLASILGELNEMAQEYGEIYDNQPESLQQGPYGQKCEAMQQLDLEASEDDDLEDLESKLDEAEGAEVPLGFGRD